MEILTVITRTKSATKSGSRQVIQRKGILLFWIASLTLAMTNSFFVRHYEVLQKTEVIHKKETLLFWIASLPFAMTNSFFVRHYEVLQKTEVIYFLRIATPMPKALLRRSRLAMTRLLTVIRRDYCPPLARRPEGTRLFIAEVIYLVDCFITFAMTEFVAMTHWFIFNSISFRDFSLLFIKKFI